MEAQRGQVTRLRPHSQQAVEPGFDSKTCDFSKNILSKHNIHAEKCTYCALLGAF